MKIIVIGATGLIGAAVVEALKQNHEVIAVGHSKGEYTVNIEDPQSITALYQKTGKVDAVVMATGKVAFLKLKEMKSADYHLGLNNKLMGQVNLVLMGLNYLNDGGSFTLTSGILNQDPIITGSSAAMVNGAIDGFVKAAAIDMPRMIRINAISPTVVTEALEKYESYFPGFEPVPLQKVVQAFRKSVEGHQTGQVYNVR